MSTLEIVEFILISLDLFLVVLKVIQRVAGSDWWGNFISPYIVDIADSTLGKGKGHERDEKYY